MHAKRTRRTLGPWGGTRERIWPCRLEVIRPTGRSRANCMCKDVRCMYSHWLLAALISTREKLLLLLITLRGMRRCKMHASSAAKRACLTKSGCEPLNSAWLNWTATRRSLPRLCKRREGALGVTFTRVQAPNYTCIMNCWCWIPAKNLCWMQPQRRLIRGMFAIIFILVLFVSVYW